MEPSQNHQSLAASTDGAVDPQQSHPALPPATIQADPLDGLRHLAKLPTDQQDDAAHRWMTVFTPWINNVMRKAQTEHFVHSSGLDASTVTRIVRHTVLKIMADCQRYPDKVNYITSLEAEVLADVRRKVAQAQRRAGIVP